MDNALLPHHLEQLVEGSGIALDTIRARGYRSISGPEGYIELKRLGFSKAQAKLTPGLLIPILGRDGQPVLYQYRPDTPRIDAKGRPIKYETPTGKSMRLDFGGGQQDLIRNPTIALWITEGVKKGDAGRTHGLCVIPLLGVDCWRGTNADGGKLALADWDDVALNDDREVYIVFDSDVTTKDEVQRALRRFRAFLINRGTKVTVVSLPPGENGAKVGLDDYLRGHSVEDLQALATARPTEGESLPDTTILPYRATSRGLVWLKRTRDGDIPTPLTNFTAMIVSDTIIDDGAETTRQYTLEASIQGRSHRFTVSAAQFPSLSWVSEHLGAQAIVYPGQTLKDHARVAIQSLSEAIVARRIFKHTGWRHGHDGHWYYFHGGGVLGQVGQVANMEVVLPPGLERFVLPDPPTGSARQQAIRASLALLDLAQDPVSVPLWAAIWRAALGSADFGVHLTGPTGAAKTEFATMAQQHFGARFDARHLPGSWLSTGNSLEDLAFTAKDAILVIDDFAPGGTASDIARTHREADRVLRAQGNQAGRQRMRADGTLRPAKPPRGLILSTGEDIPRGQSLRARMVIVEVTPGDVDWTRLTICQQAASAGQYVEAMAGFLQWLAPQYEQMQGTLAYDVAELRAQAHQDGQHQRSVNNIAQLALGVRYGLAYAHASGAISDVEREALRCRCWTALLQTSTQQQRYQDASEPTQHFLRLLSASIASGRAHVASPTGDEPNIPQAYGWRSITVGTGPYAVPTWQPQGKRIGWIDGDNLYLEPEASYAEVQSLATQQGEALAVAPRTLWKRLHERHLLASTDNQSAGRETLKVRRSLEGTRRYVLHLFTQSLTLSTHEKPAQPAQGSQAPPHGQEKPAHWAGENGQPAQRNGLSDKGSSDIGQVGQVFEGQESHDSKVGNYHELSTIPWAGHEQNLPTKPAQTCEHGQEFLFSEGDRVRCGRCLDMPPERIAALREASR